MDVVGTSRSPAVMNKGAYCTVPTICFRLPIPNSLGFQGGSSSHLAYYRYRERQDVRRQESRQRETKEKFQKVAVGELPAEETPDYPAPATRDRSPASHLPPCSNLREIHVRPPRTDERLPLHLRGAASNAEFAFRHRHVCLTRGSYHQRGAASFCFSPWHLVNCNSAPGHNNTVVVAEFQIQHPLATMHRHCLAMFIIILCTICYGAGILASLDHQKPTETKTLDLAVAPSWPSLPDLAVQQASQHRHLQKLSTLLLGPQTINEFTTPFPKEHFEGGAGRMLKITWDSLETRIRIPLNISSLEPNATEVTLTTFELFQSNEQIEREQQKLFGALMRLAHRINLLHHLQIQMAETHGVNITRTNKSFTTHDTFYTRPSRTANAAHVVAIILCICGLLGAGVLIFLTMQIKKGKGIAMVYSMLILFPANGICQVNKPVEIVLGPSSGLIVQDAPGLILTERRLISQLIFVNLDPELAIAQRRKHTLVMGPEVTSWYVSHIYRTKASVRNTLDQLVRTFIAKGDIETVNPRKSTRKKRFAAVVVGIVALSVIGVVIGSIMSSVNAATIKKVAEQTRVLRESILEIQGYIKAQSEVTDDIIQVVNSTVLIQNQNSLKIVHAAKALDKLDTARRNILDFIDPVTFATQEYLREFQNSISCLIRGQIPLYLITNEQVKALLSRLHHLEIEDLQIRVALEMGTAITIHIDPEKLQLSFLVQLPLVMADRVYQTKQVFNTGIWRGDTYMKIKAPEYLAYQNWSDNTILVPRLETCVKFKDIHHLCPGQPFLPDPSGALCGIQPDKGQTQVCDMVISKPSMSELNTVVALVQNRWLVSSRLENVTVSYALHGTFRVIPLPYRVSLITVPKDTMVMIGDKTIFHIPNEVMDGDIRLINAFPTHELALDPDLDFLLKNKAEHVVQLSISKEKLKLQKPQFSSLDLALMSTRDENWFHMLMVYIILLTLVIWILLLTGMSCQNTRYRRRMTGLSAFRRAMTHAADYTPIFIGKQEPLQDAYPLPVPQP